MLYGVYGPIGGLGDPGNGFGYGTVSNADLFSEWQWIMTRSQIPTLTIPERLRPYLLIADQNGNATELRTDRYEFWIYRQIRKRLNSGEV